ncbi:MAG: methionyl-tRNA formyltransferase [Patescibacteria group bacterium]|nr:methionyl-tRNA formyltransferase [Patescibacteria group bacterium]
MNHESTIKFAFFGSSRFSVFVLDELEKAGLAPTMIVTTPDKPAGRRLKLTPTPVKEWAAERGTKTFAPAKLDATFAGALKNNPCDVFVVASYGKMIPGSIIDIPPRKTLNIHPSLLPKYRGASPLQSAMLDDEKNTGITIMRINEKMDEGPIVAQRLVTISQWPIYEEFEEAMAREGGRLLAEVLPGWVSGRLEEKEQDHSSATYTKKIAKENGFLDLSADPYLNFRKIQAYHEWPAAYFFAVRKNHDGSDHARIRVKVTAASFKDGKLSIDRVVPEGSREMPFADFSKGYGPVR